MKRRSELSVGPLNWVSILLIPLLIMVSVNIGLAWPYLKVGEIKFIFRQR